MDWVKFNNHNSGAHCFITHLKVICLKFHSELQEYRVTLTDYQDTLIKDISASLISKDPELIKKLSPEDANRIGYMAGVNDTVKDSYV
jgi:hypothetical protein